MGTIIQFTGQVDSIASSTSKNETANGPAAYLLKQLSIGLIEAQNDMPAQESIVFLHKHMSSDWTLPTRKVANVRSQQS